jgi:hypothetical protein
MDADKKNLDRRFPDLTAETSDDETQKGKVKKFLRNKATTYTAEMIQELPSAWRVNASKHSGVVETANPNDSRRSSRQRQWLEKLAS